MIAVTGGPHLSVGKTVLDRFHSGRDAAVDCDGRGHSKCPSNLPVSETYRLAKERRS